MAVDELRIRSNDFSLDEEHLDLRDAVRAFLTRSCPIDTVREAEPLGFDAALWTKLADLRPVATGVAEARGGDGAGLLELTLIAEEHGRVLAPVPFVETMVAARALARIDGDDDRADLLTAAMDHTTIVAFAPRPLQGTTAVLVPGGVRANHVIALHDDELVLLTRDEPPPLARNRASLPIAWWDADAASRSNRTVLPSNDPQRDFAIARRDWCVLTAAALVGLAQVALDLGIEHAKEREAFGVPIGSCQAVAHPLADVATDVAAARRLVHKAAWFVDHEPDALAGLAGIAFLHAHRTASRSVDVSVHTHGGVGVTTESTVEQYFRRAKGYSLVGGDPEHELQRIADDLYGPRDEAGARP